MSTLREFIPSMLFVLKAAAWVLYTLGYCIECIETPFGSVMRYIGPGINLIFFSFSVSYPPHLWYEFADVVRGD